jgi:hypothetical protein
VDTGFGDWFQDFPHPDDFFRPLINGKSILPTNGNNFSRVSIPELDAKMNQLLTQRLADDVKKGCADLDKAYMEQARWRVTIREPDVTQPELHAAVFSPRGVRGPPPRWSAPGRTTVHQCRR